MRQARFTRNDVLNRLRSSISANRPIIAAGCSSGLIARSAAAGGADFVIVYNTGRSRLMGLPTSSTLNHANPTSLAMYPEIANVVTDLPIVGGAESADPTYLYDVERLVAEFAEAGYDGIINFPMAMPDADRTAVGLGMERDFALMQFAREAGLFTVGYAYLAEVATMLGAAGVDVIVPHAGWTTGGLAGAGDTAMPMDAACEHVQHLLELARAENPEAIALAHGGPLSSPADMEYLYEHTDAQGFVGASSMERIPVENAVIETVKAFKSFRLRTTA